jgi:hypothetical protein
VEADQLRSATVDLAGRLVACLRVLWRQFAARRERMTLRSASGAATALESREQSRPRSSAEFC